MKFDPSIHHRRSIRLKGYDYTLPGAYFVTIVTQGHKAILGEITGNEMILSQYGCLVRVAWLDLPHHYPQVELGAFVIMPNHMHGIIILTGDPSCRGGSQTRPYDGDKSNARHGLPEIVRALKSFSAKLINALRCSPGVPVWQRNYYEHIVRNQEEMEKIAAYIWSNPANWRTDNEKILFNKSLFIQRNWPLSFIGALSAE